ncbi:MAG: ATP-binding cassette domain-containing protein [bacterium]
MILTVKDLTKKFRTLTAVDQISFSVEEGEVFGFLGPNGAGKTTTISMICTLLHPTSGEIILDGVNVVTNPAQARRKMGLIFQDPSLDERLTAAENIEFQARLYGVPRSETVSRIDHLLELVQLADRKHSLVKTFSGGMRRRLEVARGLVHSPRILFLDEPTLGLDLQTRRLIWDYILRLRQEKNIVIFMTTHYIEEADICDRIAVIDRGRIVAIDTPANLIARVGKDVITFITDNDDAFCSAVKEKLGLDAVQFNGEVRIVAENGENLIPKIFRTVQVPIQSVRLNKPTLDDAFILLTGRSVRDEAMSRRESMRYYYKARERK